MHCCGHESGHSQAHVMFLSDATDVDDEDAAADDEEKKERLYRCRAGIVIRRPVLYAARIIVIVFALDVASFKEEERSQLTST